MSDKFVAIEAEYINPSNTIIKKITIEIGENNRGLRYGEIIGKDWKRTNILRKRELPDSINDFFMYSFIDSGYVIKDGLVYKEPFLVNMNILPGDKFFKIDFTVEVLKKIFIAGNIKDLTSCFSEFNLHILRYIEYSDATNGLSYRSMNGMSILGCHVIPYNVDTLDLYIEYLKYSNKDKNIKTFNTDEGIEM